MYGKSVYIIDHVLIDELNDKGFSFDAVKRDWARSGFLKKYSNKYKARKGINGESPYCIELVRSTTYR
jgi:hypothetical protein